MNILLETSDGSIVNPTVASALQGALIQAEVTNAHHNIHYADFARIPDTLQKHRSNWMPIGSVSFVKRVAALTSVCLPCLDTIPEVLYSSLRRRVWCASISEISYPCFVKPRFHVKAFDGKVFRSEREAKNTIPKELWNSPMQCSAILENILSEWRVFVCAGKVVACCHYSGDCFAFPEPSYISTILSRYVSAPAGFAADFAVGANFTELVEINDGWALGALGCPYREYFRLLELRWLELIGKKLDDVPVVN